MQELLSKKDGPDTMPLILEKKLIAFREFLSTTAALKELLLAGDMDRLDAVADHRQGLIRRIDELDGRMKRMTPQPGGGLTKAAPGKDNRPDALSAALKETITAAVKLNGECVALAAAHRDALGGELSGIRKERLALHGYAGGGGHPAGAREPRFLSVNT